MLTDTYDSFLEKSKFPSHGLIVRELATNTIIGKGITDRNILLEAIARGFNKSTQIRLETDMRAMMNPMRMKVIQELSNKLVARIQNICPACQTPGFGNISTEGKLPCKWCGSPTQLYEKVVLSCVKCDYKTYQGREDGLTQSEPTHCTFCNP